MNRRALPAFFAVFARQFGGRGDRQTVTGTDAGPATLAMWT